MAKNTSPLVVAVTGATTSAVAGILHHTDPAQIPQYSTHRLRCAFLVYICRLSGIDAERIGLPALPIIFKPNL